MAETVRIRLEGGPCNGENTTARVADFGPVAVTCKGTEYEPTARKTTDGRLIYTTKASQAAPQPAAAPNKAHSSWHTMLYNIFVDAPKELAGSRRAREALSGLRQRRGLR